MITVENIRSTVYVFGRKDKKPYMERRNFQPYFYARDPNGEYTTIDGERAKLIPCSEPSAVPEMRKNFDKTYEADVIYTNRYIIDKFKKIEKEEIRICYVDIETEMKHDIDVIKTPNAITSITCYDNFIDKFVTFIVGDGQDANSNGNSIYFFKNETAMMSKFIQFIVSTDPDMWIAWNGERFDFPYIVNRISYLGLDANKLCRIGRIRRRDEQVHIPGRILFDLMWAYKYVSQGERESYSLEYISQYELKEGKDEYDGTLDDLREKDINLYIKYNVRDVELLKMLNEKLKIVELFDTIRRKAKCQFTDVFNNSKIVDAYFLSFCKGMFVLPTKKKHHDKPIEGGLVLDPKPGLYQDIAVFDYKSLYPSIIVTFNLSPETLIERNLDLLSDKSKVISLGNNCHFRKDVKGIMPQLITTLFKERKYYKDLMKKAEYGSIDYHANDMLQYAVKVLMNSFFGVVGYPGFRLFKRDVAGSITYMARKMIKFAIGQLEQKQIKVVYGDTDSVFFDKSKMSVQETEELCNSMNKEIDTYVEKFNIQDHILELEFEKVYGNIFFSSAKKRYAGKLCWKDGKEVDDINIMGFSNRRSDSPTISRNFEKKIFEMVLNGASKEEVDTYTEEFVKQIKNDYSPEQIGLPIGISKPLEEYKGNTIHIVASRVANQYHNAQISSGDKVKYLYVKRCPPGVKTHVIAFKNKLYPGYEIDTEKMLDRLVFNKLDNIYEGLGWNIKSLQAKAMNNSVSLLEF